MTHGAAERLYAKETLQKHQDVFRSWLLPFFQGKEVESIIRPDVLALRTRFLERATGIYRQYQILMTLKLFLKFCRNVVGLTCLDPAEISLPHRKQPKVIYLRNDEVQKLRDTIPVNTFAGLRLRTLVEVLLGTGLRISEALSLDREPFDRGIQELEIRGKGGKNRILFFPESVLSWIKRFLASRPDSYPALFITTGEPPRRLARADISRFFIILRRKAGITTRLTPHILRHTYCTNLLNNGADIMHIKELVGHSDIQVTARYYLGVDRDALRKVVRRLNYTVEEPVKGAVTSELVAGD